MPCRPFELCLINFWSGYSVYIFNVSKWKAGYNYISEVIHLQSLLTLPVWVWCYLRWTARPREKETARDAPRPGRHSGRRLSKGTVLLTRLEMDKAFSHQGPLTHTQVHVHLQRRRVPLQGPNSRCRAFAPSITRCRFPSGLNDSIRASRRPLKAPTVPTSTMWFQQSNPCVDNLPWKIGRRQASNYGCAPSFPALRFR